MNTNPTDSGVQLMEDNHEGPPLQTTNSLVHIARDFIDFYDAYQEAGKNKDEHEKQFIQAMKDLGREFPVSLRLADGRLVQIKKPYTYTLEVSEPSEELK